MNNLNNNNNIQPHIQNIHNILQWNDIRYTLDKHNNTFNDIHSMRRYILSQNTHRLRTNQLHDILDQTHRKYSMLHIPQSHKQLHGWAMLDILQSIHSSLKILNQRVETLEHKIQTLQNNNI